MSVCFNQTNKPTKPPTHVRKQQQTQGSAKPDVWCGMRGAVGGTATGQQLLFTGERMWFQGTVECGCKAPGPGAVGASGCVRRSLNCGCKDCQVSSPSFHNTLNMASSCLVFILLPTPFPALSHVPPQASRTPEFVCLWLCLWTVRHAVRFVYLCFSVCTCYLACTPGLGLFQSGPCSLYHHPHDAPEGASNSHTKPR